MRVRGGRGGPDALGHQVGPVGQQVRGGLPTWWCVGFVVSQRSQRAEPVGGAQGGLVERTRVDAEAGRQLEVVHQRGPAGEPVAAGHGQLCVVQREPVPCERDVGPRVMPTDEIRGLRIVCGDGALQLAGIRAQPVERGIVGQTAGHDGLLSHARVRESGREEVGHMATNQQGG